MQLPSLKNLTSMLATPVLKTRTSGPFRLSEHVTGAIVLGVDGTKFKKEYAPDLVELVVKHGVPLKDAAELFSMSESYARKLIKGLIQ